MSTLNPGYVNRNTSKADWDNPHTVGRLKLIDLDQDIIIDGQGFCHMTLVEMATSFGL